MSFVYYIRMLHFISQIREIANITDESMITFTVTKIHIAEIIIETIGSFERNVAGLIHSGQSGQFFLSFLVFI